MKKYLLLAGIVVFGFSFYAVSKQTYDNPEAVVKQLLKSTKAWDGSKMYYPKGEAEVTAITLNIEDGYNTGFHCHPVANFGYVVSGDLEIELYTGEKKVFSKGQVFSEVINTWHRGEAVNGPVEVVIIYTGEKGTPVTILPKTDDLKNEKCVE